MWTHCPYVTAGQVLVLHGRQDPTSMTSRRRHGSFLQELVLLSPAAASILELPSEGFGFKLQEA